MASTALPSNDTQAPEHLTIFQLYFECQLKLDDLEGDKYGNEDDERGNEDDEYGNEDDKYGNEDDEYGNDADNLRNWARNIRINTLEDNLDKHLLNEEKDLIKILLNEIKKHLDNSSNRLTLFEIHEMRRDIHMYVYNLNKLLETIKPLIG